MVATRLEALIDKEPRRNLIGPRIAPIARLGRRGVGHDSQRLLFIPYFDRFVQILSI